MNIIDILDNEKIKVIDDMFPIDMIDEAFKVMTARDFPYFYYADTVNPTIHKDYIDQGIVTKDVFKDDRMVDYPMFNHYFYNISEGDKVEKKSEFNIADIMLDYFIKKYDISMPLFILKCKANLTTQVSKATKDNFSEPHIDILETPHIGMICYMNDSDGDTFFFDKDLNIIKRVQPKRGRVVIFRGETLHSAGHPIKSEQRVVMNFDFKNRNWK